MDLLRIVLACPECGNTSWTMRDGYFECLACGEMSEVGEMPAKTVVIGTTK